VSETSTKWYEFAEKNLEPGDKIEKTYPGKLDEENGYIIMSNDKLMFIHEEGLFRKNYELILDLPYEEIGKISCEGKHELDFTDVKGNKHVFKIFETSIIHVCDSFTELSHKLAK
jgi:hypothetical protein